MASAGGVLQKGLNDVCKEGCCKGRYNNRLRSIQSFRRWHGLEERKAYHLETPPILRIV